MTFQCHSLILAARSDVFAAMLRNKMSETETRTLNIVDMDPIILKALITFMYTDRVEMKDTVENLTDLLLAAEKYNIK